MSNVVELNQNQARLGADVIAFVEQVKRETQKVSRILWETRTLSSSQTFQVYERVPGADLWVSATYPSPWEDDEIKVAVGGFDGTGYVGKVPPGPGRYTRIFQKHPRITTVIHAHTPALGAFASSHSAFDIRYVPITRETIVTRFPLYLDRTQPEQDFIVEQLDETPTLEAVVEANGGSTFFGHGISKVARRIQLIEEGAGFQLHAQALGGSKPYGAGVLEQQWKMGLVPKELAEAALAAHRAAS